MRTRRVFTPAVDFMPSRLSPSAIIGTAPTPVAPVGVSAPPSQFGAMDDTMQDVTYPVIAGEPTPPPSTVNC